MKFIKMATECSRARREVVIIQNADADYGDDCPFLVANKNVNGEPEHSTKYYTVSLNRVRENTKSRLFTLADGHHISLMTKETCISQGCILKELLSLRVV